jgi:LDH2 family malate/lactate/ureidoglycolate dehydrogenase
MSTLRVALTDVRALAQATLVGLGVPLDKAEVVVEALVYADARGLGTHGVGSLATIYAPKLRDGLISASAQPRIVGGGGAIRVVDAERALGHVAMTFAVDLAIAVAQEHGIGAVAVQNSSHFGPAGYYVHRAAQHGLIALAMTNCGKQGVAPPLGGTQRLLGTNPVAAAVPAGAQPDFVLDMSTTTVATGKLAAARRAGTDIPAGWLVDAGGVDVRDPVEYFEGRAEVTWLGGRLETGAAKGYGLALLVDLLCGVLADAGWGPREDALGSGPAVDEDVGHFAIVIDPGAFGARSAFASRVDELLSTLRLSPAVAGGSVTYPGEPEARRAADAIDAGCEIDIGFVEPLLALAASLGVEAPDALRSNPGGQS